MNGRYVRSGIWVAVLQSKIPWTVIGKSGLGKWEYALNPNQLFSSGIIQKNVVEMVGRWHKKLLQIQARSEQVWALIFFFVLSSWKLTSAFQLSKRKHKSTACVLFGSQEEFEGMLSNMGKLQFLLATSSHITLPLLFYQLFLF